jgi:hypothetical protein
LIGSLNVIFVRRTSGVVLAYLSNTRESGRSFGTICTAQPAGCLRASIGSIGFFIAVKVLSVAVQAFQRIAAVTVRYCEMMPLGQ